MTQRTSTPKHGPGGVAGDGSSTRKPSSMAQESKDSPKSRGRTEQGSKVSETAFALRYQKSILKRWSIASLDDILPPDLRPKFWTEAGLRCLDTLSKHETLESTREIFRDQIDRRCKDDMAQGKVTMTVRRYPTKRDLADIVRRYKQRQAWGQGRNKSLSSRETTADARNDEEDDDTDISGGTIVVNLGSDIENSTEQSPSTEPEHPKEPEQGARVNGSETAQQPASRSTVASTPLTPYTLPRAQPNGGTEPVRRPSGAMTPETSQSRPQAAVNNTATQQPEKGKSLTARQLPDPYDFVAPEPLQRPVPGVERPARASDSRPSRSHAKTSSPAKTVGLAMTASPAETANKTAVPMPNSSKAAPASQSADKRHSAGQQAIGAQEVSRALAGLPSTPVPGNFATSNIPSSAPSGTVLQSHDNALSNGTSASTKPDTVARPQHLSVSSSSGGQTSPASGRQLKTMAVNQTRASELQLKTTAANHITPAPSPQLKTTAATTKNTSSPAHSSAPPRHDAQRTAASDAAAMKLAASALRVTHADEDGRANSNPSSYPSASAPSQSPAVPPGPGVPIALLIQETVVKETPTPVYASSMHPATVTNVPLGAVQSLGSTTSQLAPRQHDKAGPVNARNAVAGTAGNPVSQTQPGHSQTTMTGPVRQHNYTAAEPVAAVADQRSAPGRNGQPASNSFSRTSVTSHNPTNTMAQVLGPHQPASQEVQGGYRNSSPPKLSFRQPASQQPTFQKATHVPQNSVSNHSAAQQPGPLSQQAVPQQAAPQQAVPRQPVVQQAISQQAASQQSGAQYSSFRQGLTDSSGSQRPGVQHPASQQAATQSPLAQNALSRLPVYPGSASPDIGLRSAALGATSAGSSVKRKHLSRFETPLPTRIGLAEREEIAAQAQLNYLRAKFEAARSRLPAARAEYDRLVTLRERRKAATGALDQWCREFADAYEPAKAAGDGSSMDFGAQTHDASQGSTSGTDVKAWINWIQYSASRIQELSADEQLAAKLGEMEDEIREAEDQLRAAEEDERLWAATLTRVQEELAGLYAERDQENVRKRQRAC